MALNDILLTFPVMRSSFDHVKLSKNKSKMKNISDEGTFFWIAVPSIIIFTQLNTPGVCGP